MRAYNMAMGFIYFNCGFPLAVAIGGFGSIEKHTAGYTALSWLANPIFKIGSIEVTGMHAVIGIALLMIAATALVLNSRIVSSQGVAIGAFTGIFWGSFGTSSLIFLALSAEFPGLNILWVILLISAAMIFVIALVQMPTGGQKAHV